MNEKYNCVITVLLLLRLNNFGFQFGINNAAKNVVLRSILLRTVAHYHDNSSSIVC